EDLAVADLSGPGAGADRLDRGIDQAVVDGDLDPVLGQHVHGHGPAPVLERDPLLLTTPSYLGDGHAEDTPVLERLLDEVEPLGPDDRGQEVHCRVPLMPVPARRAERCRGRHTPPPPTRAGPW